MRLTFWRKARGEAAAYARSESIAGAPGVQQRDEGDVRKQRQRYRQQRGTAAVEFAIVAIPLFLFIFASIEFGRSMMAVQSMEEAARVGCRSAIVQGATTDSVEADVAEAMLMSGISNYTVEIEPSDFTAFERWEPISVTITATFADMSYLPAPMYLGGMSFSSSCTLAKECSSGS